LVQSWRVGSVVDGAVAVSVARERFKRETLGDLAVRSMLIKFKDSVGVLTIDWDKIGAINVT
jgi:hypothetical protein